MISVPPVARPLRRRDKIGEVIARDILRRIREEGLVPGDHLPTEAQMIAEYGVGRGTLREALRILEVPGLITIKPGPRGGPVVAGASSLDFGRMATLFFQVDGMTFGEVVEARLILEPIAGRLAAQRRDAEGIAKLQAFLDSELPTDEASYLRATYDFHHLVVQLSGNGVVALFTQALADLYHDRVDGIVFPNRTRRRQVLDVHHQIAQAIIDGDAEVTEKLMYEHMEQYTRYVETKFATLMNEIVDWR